MIKNLVLSIILIIFGANSIMLREVSAQAAATSAQTAVPLEVIARNGAGTEKHLLSRGGFVGQLVVRQNEAVPITLQFPSDKVGMPVAVDTLDGGNINAGRLVVLPTGKVLFTFRGEAPGLYRLVIQLPGEQHRFEIYVVDPNRPRNTSRSSLSFPLEVTF